MVLASMVVTDDTPTETDKPPLMANASERAMPS